MHNHNLDPRATIVLDLVPRASVHQADEARLLNFLKFLSRQSYVSLNMDRGNLGKRLKFGRNYVMVTLFAQP